MRALLLVLVAGSLPAQVPDGGIAVGSYAGSTASTNPGGIVLVDPRVAGPPTPITGLGLDLTGPPNPGLLDFGGTAAVAALPDGALLAGEILTGPGTVDVHWIRLQAVAVVQDVRIPLAPRRGFSGSVEQIQLLDNGDAIAAINGLAAPFDATCLAYIDVRARVATPIPMTSCPGVPNAVAVDRTGRTAYIAVRQPPLRQAVFALSIPAGGAPVLLGYLSGEASGLDVDSDGNLIAAVHDLLTSQSQIVRVDPTTWTSTVIGVTPNPHKGLVHERATGFNVYATGGPSAALAGCYWMDAAGGSTLLATSLPGLPSSVSIRHDPHPYGRPTPGSSRYAWDAWPSPGGLPRVGNAGFGLRVEAVPGPGSPGLLLAAAAEGYTVVFGVELWLAPATLVSVGGIVPGRTFALPLPAIPMLIGQSVFFQSAHPDPGAPAGFAATEGLRVTLLR